MSFKTIVRTGIFVGIWFIAGILFCFVITPINFGVDPNGLMISLVLLLAGLPLQALFYMLFDIKMLKYFRDDPIYTLPLTFVPLAMIIYLPAAHAVILIYSYFFMDFPAVSIEMPANTTEAVEQSQ